VETNVLMKPTVSTRLSDLTGENTRAVGLQGVFGSQVFARISETCKQERGEMEWLSSKTLTEIKEVVAPDLQ
jgi:hypothetical protein